MENKLSRQINMFKAFSIFCVICAHCNTVDEGASHINIMTHYLLNALGTIGVGCFFAVSGYLYVCCSKKEENLMEFLLKKVKRLLVPWLICGTLVWLYIVLRKGGISFASWFAFLMGKGSYLYFIPSLFVFFILAKIWDGYMLPIYIGMALSVVSNMLTIAKIFPMEFAYINMFNWFIYFAIGICLAKWKWETNKYVNLIGILLAVVSLGIIMVKKINIHYWSWGYILFEVFASISLWAISGYLAQKEHFFMFSGLNRIGEQTLPIYLLHMPIAGMITSILGKWDIWWLTLARPFLVLIITLLGLSLYHLITSKLLKCKMLDHLIGIK